MGTGPFDEEGEQEAARLLRQLSDYTSTVVRQEVHRAQSQRQQSQERALPRDHRLTAGALLGLLGLATLVAAAVILLANVLGAGLAAIAIGTALLVSALGLILSATRRAAGTNSAES